MLSRIYLVRSRPVPWRGRCIQQPVPFGSGGGGGGGGGTRTIPAIVVVWPRPGRNRLLAWRLSHVLIRATFGPPPPPPTFVLAFVMASARQIELAMAYRKTLYLSMTSTNTLNLVMHGS